jgi:hypothetical protein
MGANMERVVSKITSKKNRNHRWHREKLCVLKKNFLVERLKDEIKQLTI